MKISISYADRHSRMFHSIAIVEGEGKLDFCRDLVADLSRYLFSNILRSIEAKLLVVVIRFCHQNGWLS